MEPVIKIEKCDDEEEFQCITVEETQLSEVNLTQESRLITKNNLKRSYSTMLDGTQTIAEDVHTGTLPPEEERQTPTEKTSKRNDSEVLDTNLIYSPPFFKIIHQLGPDKDIYISRCYSCGRLMRSLAKQPLKLIQHIRSSHQEVAKIYEKYESDHLRKSHNEIDTTNAETSNNCSVVEINKNCSKVNDNLLEDISGAVQNDNHTQDFIIEIIDDDDNENTVNDELTSNQGVSITGNYEKAEEYSTTSLKKLGDVINQRLQKFVRETGFKELNNKVDELLKKNTKNDSNSHSVIKELRSEVNNLKNECKALRLAVLQTQASKRHLQNRLQKMENYLQQRKLIIKNIGISNRQQPIKDVAKFFKDSLNLDNISIVKCSIIPSLKKSCPSTTSTDTESVSVELLQVEDCKLVLRQMHKLKNTGIFIEPELTPLQRKRKNKLMILRKELLSLKSDLKILVHNTTLVVNGKNFYWDDTEGLYHNEAEDIQTTGVEYLNNLTGLDLKEFNSFLLKYEMNAKRN